MNIIAICAIVGAVFGALPWIATIVQALVNYWLRQDSSKLVGIALCVTTLGHYRSFEEDVKKKWDDTAIGMYSLGTLGTTFGYTVLGIIVGELVTNGYLWHSIITVGVILSTIFVPRWVLDISKSITYNRKTGNAERIDKLERELEDLKRKG